MNVRQLIDEADLMASSAKKLLNIAQVYRQPTYASYIRLAKVPYGSLLMDFKRSAGTEQVALAIEFDRKLQEMFSKVGMLLRRIGSHNDSYDDTLDSLNSTTSDRLHQDWAKQVRSLDLVVAKLLKTMDLDAYTTFCLDHDVDIDWL